jgi:hypothetical protein
MGKEYLFRMLFRYWQNPTRVISLGGTNELNLVSRGADQSETSENRIDNPFPSPADNRAGAERTFQHGCGSEKGQDQTGQA